MGLASRLFYDPTDSGKQTLHRRIIPSEAQFEEQQERWNALADELTAAVKDESGCPVRTWLQGSYKFGTQVRPPRGEEFDIDLGIYFEWDGAPEGGEHGPKSLKAMVQGALQRYEAKTEDAIEVVQPPKKRCSRIRFKGDFHIDIPAYHLDAGRDRRSLATEDDEWEGSDPKALYTWFKDELDEDRRPQARRVIRYFKSWSLLKFGQDEGRPASVLLTVLVAEAMAGTSIHLLGDDDDVFAEVVTAVRERLDTEEPVRNPIDSDEVLSARMSDDEWSVFRSRLRILEDKGREALAATSVTQAATLWSEIFEHFFPAPDEDTSTAKSSFSLVPIKFIPEIQVFAAAKNNQNLVFSGKNKIGPIPRDCSIQFILENAPSLPSGSRVEWIVRNESEEAEYVNDLGHHSGYGNSSREETSKYKGTHYMDCIIRRYGIVIGFRRVPVEIHGVFAPRRNPLRPSWVALRGRR